MPDKPRHVPVNIKTALYADLRAYSDKTRVPVTAVLEEAVRDWLETVGSARLEALKEITGKIFLVAKAAPQEP